jgi:hypothetical protein
VLSAQELTVKRYHVLLPSLAFVIAIGLLAHIGRTLLHSYGVLRQICPVELAGVS